jgi:DNA polymerase III epsilon subunit-like protein
MATLCFTDTETTSLRADRRAWEIGIIAREPGKPDVEHHWFIDADDLDLGNADVMSLRVGRFYERHPGYQLEREAEWTETGMERDVLREVEAITRGAHLVGAVVNFDADVLGARMRANGICPSWHYHLIDIEALTAGWIHAHAAALEKTSGAPDEDAARLRELASPPWKSDDLSDALGITVSDEDRHTALGDARWAMAIYDKITGRA